LRQPGAAQHRAEKVEKLTVVGGIDGVLKDFVRIPVPATE
jgi:hypothetical protein